MKLLNQRIFIGVLLCLPLFSSAAYDIEITVSSPPPADNNSYTMDTFGEVVSEEEYYTFQQQNMDGPYAPFPWPCDPTSTEDCAQVYPENTRDTVSLNDLPCASLEECARMMYHENIKRNIVDFTERNIGRNDVFSDDFSPTNYDDFFTESARMYNDNAGTDCTRMRGINGDTSSGPYAPFPWPCDPISTEGYLNQLQMRSINMVFPF